MAYIHAPAPFFLFVEQFLLRFGELRVGQVAVVAERRERLEPGNEVGHGRRGFTELVVDIDRVRRVSAARAEAEGPRGRRRCWPRSATRQMPRRTATRRGTPGRSQTPSASRGRAGPRRIGRVPLLLFSARQERWQQNVRRRPAGAARVLAPPAARREPAGEAARERARASRRRTRRRRR